MHSISTPRFGSVAGLSALCLTLAAQCLLAGPVESQINAVTVYADRAVVTRVAKLEVSQLGALEAEFSGLPLSLVDQSLQVSGKGSAQVTILDVTARVEHLDFTPNERIKALEDELHGLDLQRRLLGDRETVLKHQDDYLIQIRNATTQPPAEGQVRPSIEEWGKLLAFQDEALTKMAKEQQAISKEDEGLLAKVEAVKAQLNELRGNRGRSVKKVVVRLNASSTGEVTVALSYALSGASWSPAYDARLHTEARELELSYFGIVRNATGEDWKDVTLTLSTARPSMGGAAPELRPWIVDIARPVMRKMPMPARSAGKLQEEEITLSGFVVSSAEDKGYSASSSLAGTQNVTLSDSAIATVGTSATSATFAISAPVTLPADNTTQKVPIASAKHMVPLQYQTTPKLHQAAFLNATFTNTSDYPLLAGAVSSFLDDTFVATSSIKTVMPGEKFELSLGADEGIAIKRRQVNRFTEATGLTSKTTRITYEYLVTITNNKKSSERVVMSEPIPVSRNEKIEVQLLTPAERDLGTKDNPKEVTREEDTRLVWKLDLKPGEKRELPLKFTVEHASDLAVTGLE
ncbi:MAG: mucoidy inhibitor MuiA family protein [Opitutaceae bacterium]